MSQWWSASAAAAGPTDCATPRLSVISRIYERVLRACTRRARDVRVCPRAFTTGTGIIAFLPTPRAIIIFEVYGRRAAIFPLFLSFSLYPLRIPRAKFAWADFYACSRGKLRSIIYSWNSVWEGVREAESPALSFLLHSNFHLNRGWSFKGYFGNSLNSSSINSFSGWLRATYSEPVNSYRPRNVSPFSNGRCFNIECSKAIARMVYQLNVL